MLYDCNIPGHPYKGDMVWLHWTVAPPHSHHKLHHPWTGPYQIVSKLSDLNYKIAPVDDLSKTVVHFDLTKILFLPTHFFPLHSSPFSQSQPSSSSYRVGDNVTLLDLSDDGLDDEADAPEAGSPPPCYPTCYRHAPDCGLFLSVFLQSFISCCCLFHKYAVTIKKYGKNNCFLYSPVRRSVCALSCLWFFYICSLCMDIKFFSLTQAYIVYLILWWIIVIITHSVRCMALPLLKRTFLLLHWINRRKSFHLM